MPIEYDIFVYYYIFKNPPLFGHHHIWEFTGIVEPDGKVDSLFFHKTRCELMYVLKGIGSSSIASDFINRRHICMQVSVSGCACWRNHMYSRFLESPSFNI